MAGVMNHAPASRDQIQMDKSVAAMRMAVRALIASAAIVAIGGVAAAQTRGTESTERPDCTAAFEAEVVKSMYSGLPNPHFVLLGDDAKSLWDLLARPRELGWRHPFPTDVGLGGYYV